MLCSTKSKHAIHRLKHRGGVPTRRDSVPACYISPRYDGRERQHGGAGAVADNVGFPYAQGQHLQFRSRTLDTGSFTS